MAAAAKKSSAKKRSSAGKSAAKKSASLPKGHNPANPIGGFSDGGGTFADERKGLETGSRADTRLSESEAPSDEKQTMTPIAEPAPAVNA